MADVELLPLPAIERWEVTGDYAFPTATDPEGHAVDYDAHVDAMQSYACACVEANLAPLQAENERLRAEVERLNDLCNGLQRSLSDSQAGYVHYRARAERLAEALRDARRALAFASQHLPECNDPYERANRALAQEDRNV